MLTPRVLLLIVLILSAAFTRLVPHLQNAAPVAAVALFAAAYLPSRRWSILLPLAAMLISDIVLYSTKDMAYREQALTNMIFVYSAYAGIALLGQWLRRKVTVGRIMTAAVSGSALFFLVTNFGSWLLLSHAAPPMYSQTFSGLMDCYIAGIPFFRGTFFGDLFYTAALFGGFALMDQKIPQFRQQLIQPTSR